MAKLKSAQVGDIIQVPGRVMFPRCTGPKRWSWPDALVTRVYQAKGGPAVEVEEEWGPTTKRTARYLISKCRQSTNPVITADTFKTLRFKTDSFWG